MMQSDRVRIRNDTQGSGYTIEEVMFGIDSRIERTAIDETIILRKGDQQLILSEGNHLNGPITVSDAVKRLSARGLFDVTTNSDGNLKLLRTAVHREDGVKSRFGLTEAVDDIEAHKMSKLVPSSLG